MTQQDSATDVWSRWLLHVRSGGDAAFEQVLRAEIEIYVDRILNLARIEPGMTLLDVGTGEGPLPFRAIERYGPTLTVILTDISEPLLRRAQAIADQLGVQNQCSFVACGADQLTGIPDASIDVVTTRSALAYVPDKTAALREFNRVLKPGGRISLGEPIFQDDAFEACVLKALAERASQDRLKTLMHRWKSAQFPDTHAEIAANPLTNFSERTLFELIRASGFSPVHLEFHVDLSPSPMTSWQICLESSPHPLAPSLATILQEKFNQEERELFESVYRPLIESGSAMALHRMAYFTATKTDARSAPLSP